MYITGIDCIRTHTSICFSISKTNFKNRSFNGHCDQRSIGATPSNCLQ